MYLLVQEVTTTFEIDKLQCDVTVETCSSDTNYTAVYCRECACRFGNDSTNCHCMVTKSGRVVKRVAFLPKNFLSRYFYCNKYLANFGRPAGRQVDEHIITLSVMSGCFSRNSTEIGMCKLSDRPRRQTVRQ